MSKDMMPMFELYQPTDLANALDLADDLAAEGWAVAGGQDSLDWFKDRVRRPRVVVDLGGIDSLKEIRSTADGGIEIGAMARLIDVVEHAEIRSQFPALAYAARSAASPQIRNIGTIGGNVSQDTRCWYYRDGWTCYRAGGNICYASPPTAMNREHCILGRAGAWQSIRRIRRRSWSPSRRRWSCDGAATSVWSRRRTTSWVPRSTSNG